MNIKRAKEEIKNTIKAYLTKDSHGEYEIPSMRQRPVLLMGPPGIGKTQIMEQVARECQIGLVSYTITHHTRQSAIGLPFISEKVYGGESKHVTEYTMSEIVAAIYDKMEATGLKEGILFIDEINCVSETLAPAMLQFLQYKTFGNHKIPDGWIIAAAGNPPEYNKSVRDFDIATLDRVKKIDVEADFAVWKEYAKQAEIHPAIISYLTAKPQYFYQVETTVDGKIFATPRGWEDLSRFLEVYERIGLACDRDVVKQYIQHAKISKDFANYLELYYKYQSQYQIDEVLKGNRDEELMIQAARAPFDEKLSVIGLLLAKLNVEFGRSGKMEAYLELLFEKLKAFKARLAEAGEQQPLDIFAALTDEIQAEYETKKKAGLLTREDQYRYRDVLDSFNRYFQTAKGESLTDGEEIFERFAGMFGEEREKFEAQCDHALQMLEYAFDFMEGTFEDSQEMVIFITELNTSFYAVKFLSENECERYFRYNSRLLFDNRAAEIIKTLDRLGEF
ncbi:MAG: AAA family ATPase [Lachnospiraceae bacterium]|nr:AAA family ATPase [Lachnospiraceae bacterium]